MRLVSGLLFAALAVPADGATVDVSLRVIDAATSAALTTATVAVDGRTLTVDGEGRLTVSLGVGRWTLEVRAPGYVDRAVPVDTAEVRSLEVALVPRTSFRERVEVLASPAPATTSSASTAVRPTEVTEVAGGGENVFRVLQTLPGVASPEDFSSRISVRGGGPDQNLTVMDGVEIHNPYRLFGLTSAFNPETVEGFELTAGGFGATHGDRLSSLLVVHNRAGSESRTLTGSGALSLTDTNAILEGRTPFGSGSWLLTGRRTYYDLVVERFVDQDLPSFNDLQARTVFRLGGGRTLSLFGLRSREATDASFDVPEEGAEGALFTRTRNDLLAASFAAPLGGRGLARSTASAYTNTDSVDFGGDFRNETRRSNSPGNEAFAQSRVEVTWEGSVRDHALRQELTFQASKRHLLEGGLELHRLRTGVRFEIPGERNPTEANTSSLAGGAGLPDELDSSRSDTRVGAWLQDRFTPSSRLTIQAGLRLDRSTVNARTYLTPRLSGTLVLTPATRLRAALGVYTQSPGYEKLVQSDYFIDLTSSAPLGLESERARHLLLGLERDLPAGLFGRVEGYYKGFDRLIAGRLETSQETAARVAGYDFPPELAGSIPREPWITTAPTNQGRGRAYGFDLYLSRRAAARSTRLTGWASYTYGVATREAYGLTLPFDYDRRHAVTLVGSFRLTSKLALSTTARLASGFPRTPVQGLRVSAVPDVLDRDGDANRVELVPERDATGQLVYATDLGGVGNLNTARLPHYERLDARLTWTPGGPRGRVKLYLDVINVLNRHNAAVLEPRLLYDPSSDRPRLVEEATGSLPFLPSFGVHVTFNSPAPRGAQTAERPERPGGGWAVSARPMGTQGLGLDLTRSLHPRLNAVGGVSLPGTFAFDATASGTDYDVEMAFGGAQARLNWHPFRGGFHVSSGVLRTRHRFEIRARPADPMDLGGRAYSAAEVGALTGEGRVRNWAPYFGLGWGNAVGKGRRFRVVFDVGVAPQGRPTVALTTDAPTAASAGLRESLVLEARDLEDRLAGWRIFPVVSLSLSRRF